MDRKSDEKNNGDGQAMRHPSAFDFSVLDEGPGPSDEPLSPDVEVNSMVKVTMADTTEHFGVIRWIGIPEGSKTERLVAGIELENTLSQGATDGTFNKQRYFECEPNKAIFVYLSRCRPDSRFLSQSQTFQLSKSQTSQAGEKNQEDQQAVRHSSSFDFSAFDGGPGPSSDLPLSLDLEVNSMVEVTMADTTEHFGVIRWIGIPEGSKSERLVAGIELESSLSQGATDGTFNKQRYFQCEPNKAIFVFLSRCRPDSRFFSRSQTFQLSKRQTSQDNVLPGLSKRAQSLPSALYSSEAVQNPAGVAVDDDHSLVLIGSASGNTFNFTQNVTVSGPTEQDKKSQWPTLCLGASEGLQRLLSEDSVPQDTAQTTEQVLGEIDNLVQAVTLNAHTTRRKIANLLCLNKEDSRNIEAKGSAD